MPKSGPGWWPCGRSSIAAVTSSAVASPRADDRIGDRLQGEQRHHLGVPVGADPQPQARRLRRPASVLMPIPDGVVVAAGDVCPSARTMSAGAVLTGWYELEHRVAVRLGDEVLHRGVLGRLEVRPRGRGDADVSLEDGPG